MLKPEMKKSSSSIWKHRKIGTMTGSFKTIFLVPGLILTFRFLMRSLQSHPKTITFPGALIFRKKRHDIRHPTKIFRACILSKLKYIEDRFLLEAALPGTWRPLNWAGHPANDR